MLAYILSIVVIQYYPINKNKTITITTTTTMPAATMVQMIIPHLMLLKEKLIDQLQMKTTTTTAIILMIMVVMAVADALRHQDLLG